MQGIITVKEIDMYSRVWSNPDVDPGRRLLLAAIESEVLAQQCTDRDLVYEAIQFHLGRLRLLSELSYEGGGPDLGELWTEGVRRLHEMCVIYLSRFRDAWTTEKDLVST